MAFWLFISGHNHTELSAAVWPGIRAMGFCLQDFWIQFIFLPLTHRITFLWVTYPFGLSLLMCLNGFSTSALVLLFQSASKNGVRQPQPVYMEERAHLGSLPFLRSFSIVRWLLGSFPFVLCLQLLPPCLCPIYPRGQLVRWVYAISNFNISCP